MENLVEQPSSQNHENSLHDDESEEMDEEHVFIPRYHKDTKDILSQFRRRMEKKDEEISKLHNKLDTFADAMAQLTCQIADMRQGNNSVPHTINLSPSRPNSSTRTRRSPEGDTTRLTSAQIRDMVHSQVETIVAEGQTIKDGISSGRPYPAAYDLVDFPPGYVIPKFVRFNDIGDANQHVAHFKATHGNTGGNSTMLLWQFVSSLTG